jgi:hypothetical protein
MATRVFGKSELKAANGTSRVDVASVTSTELSGQIGETAGKVWQALSSEGPLTLTDLKKKVADGQGDLVSLAIGWLAREDKVNVTPEKKGLRVQLK